MNRPPKGKNQKSIAHYWPWTRPVVFSNSALNAFGAFMDARLKELEKEQGKNAPPSKPT